MLRRLRSAWLLVVVLLLVLIGVSFTGHPRHGPSIDDMLRHNRNQAYDREGASPRP